MAPIKRPGESLDDSIQQDGDSVSSGSSTPDFSRKKARTSTARGLGSEEDEDSQSEGSFASDFDEDIDERATQAVQEKYARQVENIAAEYGIIERVECYNFMCHEHFSVELGPLINFIVGKNGSGKSAVLTALTLCLGGKASATNRGQSLKNFIKEGKESATIIVRIKNQGDIAYMPEVYGKQIIVERHFSKNGSSGFKLKTEKTNPPRIISTKKADLDVISDYFSLQIDNPMNVLSQDMARQFLSTSSSTEKYKFFIRGVQLEQLDQDYRSIEDSVDQIEHKLAGREEDLEVLKTRMERAQARLAMSDKHQSLRDRAKHLRFQMAWAQVEEQEHIRDSIEDELSKASEAITNAETEVGRFDATFENAEREHQAATEALVGVRAEHEQIKEQENEIKGRIEEGMQERHDLQAQQRSIGEILKNADKELKKTHESIREETQRLEDVNGGSHTRRLKERDQQEVEVENCRSRHKEHQRGMEQLQEDSRKAEADLKYKSGPISKQRSDIQQADNALRNLMKDRGHQSDGFHNQMPTLLRAIEQESSFGARPIGPLGQHVRLLKPKWSAVLENSFGGTLGSFLVSTKRDMNTLLRIMQRVNCVCPILIGGSSSIDTSAHEPDAEFDTALRVLEIDNDAVRRQLVINHGIEQMLLIEKLEEASAVLFDGPRPKNVKRCYCIDQTDRRRGIHLSYSRTGEPTQAPVSAYTGKPRMKTDLESRIRMQKDAVDQLKRGLNDLEEQYRAARSHLEKCKQAIVRHQREDHELRVATQRAEDRLEEIKEAIEKDSVEDGRLDVLHSTVKEIEEEKRVNEGSYEDGVVALDTVNRKIRDIKREQVAKAKEVAEAESRVNEAASHEAELREKRRKLLSAKNEAIGRVGIAKDNKTAIERRRDQILERILDYNEKATQISPRIAVDEGETTHSLDAKLSKLRSDLERFNQQMGANREEIGAEAKETENAYSLALEGIRGLKQLAQELKKSLNIRKDRWYKFRSLISSKAKAQFTYLLSERSFRGSLLADHNAKQLDVQVEPDITKVSQGRGAKTLSGGEKSFSQICLLLSLWEAMGSPIRCLDEFDVYMDSVNRKMAIDMLLYAARRSIGRQFILITPGSRTEIKVAPDVKVKELAEPERGQRTISFAR
ncbi:Structural maintenance of chromosomes protein 6 [Arachnomyces sp. PD_36]|nr:Structural maintenance of chromosomes protein 6 [Arachnomyces sp. PD_36]